MDVNVAGRKIDIGESFKVHINDRLNQMAEKYFSRTTDANVTVAKDGHLFKVDCLLHAPNGVHMRSHGEASEVYAAFDDAAEKVEKQLRRYKRRIKNHHISAGKGMPTPEEMLETVEKADD